MTALVVVAMLGVIAGAAAAVAWRARAPARAARRREIQIARAIEVERQIAAAQAHGPTEADARWLVGVADELLDDGGTDGRQR